MDKYQRSQGLREAIAARLRLEGVQAGPEFYSTACAVLDEHTVAPNLCKSVLNSMLRAGLTPAQILSYGELSEPTA